MRLVKRPGKSRTAPFSLKLLGRAIGGITILFVSLSLAEVAACGQLRSGGLYRVLASPPRTGNHSLIDLTADPDVPGDMFACGYRYSEARNAMIGFLYRSQDDGRSWSEALNDDSSDWVSEESCAAGGGGRVFFMAESALMIHGKVPAEVPLQQRGQIHLYFSGDSGRSWTLIHKEGWLDHTAMAVDWTHGPRRGRMYLFGQASGHNQFGYYNQMQVITSDGDRISPPVSVPQPSDFIYRAGYAAAARVLPNGDALAIFLTKRGSIRDAASSEDADTHIEIFAVRDGGHSMLGTADLGSIQPCLGAMPSLDVNQSTGAVFAVWGTMERDRCELRISSSQDEGRTWAPAKKVIDDGYVPEIAVSDAGVISLFWLSDANSHCWSFVSSSDGGVSFAPALSISRCIETSAIANLSQSARDASPEVHKAATGAGWQLEPGAIGFSVIAARDGLIPDRTGLIADNNGSFHCVWPEATDENGALWSGTILDGTETWVAKSQDAIDVSDQVALQFRNAVFDPGTGIYAVDVTITNLGKQALGGHMSLHLENAYSRFFQNVTPIGSDDESNRTAAFWAVWPAKQDNLLAPDATSSPRRLSFLLKNKSCDSAAFGDLLAVRLSLSLIR
jgi:hypothetical protein